MIMNKLFSCIYCLFLIVLLTGCSSSDDEDDLAGDWIRQSDFEGVSRSDAAAFVIDNLAYVGTGYTSSTSSTDSRLTDFWKYDPTQDNWYSIAAFPGKARSKAVAFSANGKGYVGLGTDGTNVLKDFWQYDPVTDEWRQIADFPTIKGRYGAVAFTLDESGYVGCGNDGDNDQQDFYRYDAGSNSWTQMSSMKTKRVNSFAFVINNKAYVGGGSNNGAYVGSFYSYDATDNSWTKLHSLYPDGDSEETDEIQDNEDYDYNLQRTSAASFTINGYGYISTGTSSAVLNSTWQYNPGKDIWDEVDVFEGTSREGSVSFALNNQGYIATGRSGTLRLDDLWKYDPNTSDDDQFLNKVHKKREAGFQLPFFMD